MHNRAEGVIAGFEPGVPDNTPHRAGSGHLFRTSLHAVSQQGLRKTGDGEGRGP